MKELLGKNETLTQIV